MRARRGKNHVVNFAVAALALLLGACGTGQTRFSIPICDEGGCHCYLPGFVICDHVCVNPDYDHGNCGACGKSCDSGEVCSNGSCGPDCGSATKCDDRCQYDDSPYDCGTCGNQCEVTCIGGFCVNKVGPDMACSDGLMSCSGICVDTATDINNCGGCGLKCEVGSTCFIEAGVGMCCESGGQLCDNICSDPLSDSSNCGGCGNVCDEETICSDGLCQ